MNDVISITKKTLALVLFILLVSSVPIWAKPLQVVTTFSVLEDLVQQVGGEKVEVRSLIPRGADPHSWEPSPREARLIAQADLIVANGAGFDNWMVGLVQNAAREDAVFVFASEGLTLLDHDHSHHLHDHTHSGDPHLWLNVQNAIFYVEKIAATLIELSPQNTQYFTDNLNVYTQELSQLDQILLYELGQIPKQNRVIVTYHNAFSYLAERYGFQVVEFLVENPEAEPNPRDLAGLVNLLSKQENPVVFSEAQLTSGTRYVQALANEVGAEIYTLYSDSLSPDVPTYLEMMKYNMRTLVEALE